MIMSLGWLRGRTSCADLGGSWTMTWVGNLVGLRDPGRLFVAGGGGVVFSSKSQFIFAVAAAKMNAPALALFARAILCNWLVCLAIWMSARMVSDAAKCIAIFWCLFAFIGSGYEHSIANMTLLLIALLGKHPDTVTWGGLAYNLFWVTSGNIVSGAGIMGVGYFAATPAVAVPKEADVALAAE